MTEWEPIFFGCPDLEEYSWQAGNPLIPVLDSYCRQSNVLPEKQTKWIVGEKDGKVFFGRHGHIRDLLGWEHEAAKDKSGRSMAFFLGYSAPAGTPLPRVEDFGKIEDEILKRDLDDLCRKFSRPSFNKPVIEPVSFDFSVVGDRTISEHPWKEWNDLVLEIEKGKKKSTLLVINQQGEIGTKDLPLSHASDFHPSEDETERKKKSEEKSGKSDGRWTKGSVPNFGENSASRHWKHWTRNTDNSRRDNSPAFDSKTVNVALGAAGLGLGLAAFLAWIFHKKDKDKQKEQAKTRG